MSYERYMLVRLPGMIAEHERWVFLLLQQTANTGCDGMLWRIMLVYLCIKTWRRRSIPYLSCEIPTSRPVKVEVELCLCKWMPCGRPWTVSKTT